MRPRPRLVRHYASHCEVLEFISCGCELFSCSVFPSCLRICWLGLAGDCFKALSLQAAGFKAKPSEGESHLSNVSFSRFRERQREGEKKANWSRVIYQSQPGRWWSISCVFQQKRKILSFSVFIIGAVVSPVQVNFSSVKEIYLAQHLSSFIEL